MSYAQMRPDVNEGRQRTIEECERGDPSWPPPRWTAFVHVMPAEALRHHARRAMLYAPAARAELARRGIPIRVWREPVRAAVDGAMGSM